MKDSGSSRSTEEAECGGVKNVVDLDNILVEEVGQLGWYQLRTAALLAFALVMSGFQTEYIFTAGRIATRCAIPECERTSSPEFSPSWILTAIPGSSSTDFDNCRRFANTTVIDDVTNTSCPAELFDRSTTIPCDSYVYENTDTVVFDYNLACDEWRRTLIGSIRTVGTLVAMPLAGYVSDMHGRRTALAVAGFNTAWIGLTRYWAKTYVGFVLTEFFEALVSGGITTCVYILVLELVGPKYRVSVSAAMISFFALGQVTLGLLAWAVPNWQNLTLVLYIPQLAFIAYFWVVAESVRWYMSKGRFEKAEKVLVEVARVNGRTLSQKSLAALRAGAEQERQRQEAARAQQAREPALPVLVWRNKRVLLGCLVCPVWWVTTVLIYYGNSINSVHMSGNKYINYMVVSAVEIPGFWVSGSLSDKFGRKPVLAGSFWACSICQLVYLFMPDNLYAATLTVVIIGQLCIAVVVQAIYLYTTEFFPTKYRHRLFAFCSTVGRVGAITAPLTPAFGDRIPFILFGTMALVSGLLVLVTPETLGAPMPDTMEEAANIGRNAKK